MRPTCGAASRFKRSRPLMASAYLDEDSDSDRRSSSGGHRHRGRGRRGGKRSVWPRETNVHHYADDDSCFTRDFKSLDFSLLTSRNQKRLEERPGHSRRLCRGETHDNVREKYPRYHEGGNARTANNDFYVGLPLPLVYSGREEKWQFKDNSSDHFGFNQHDKEYRSSYSSRIKNDSFYHDKSGLMPRKGRGGRGRARGSKDLSRYSNREESSNREENPAIFDSDWREGMPSVGK